jgi:alpha-glucosidase
MEIYVHINNEPHGPYTPEQIHPHRKPSMRRSEMRPSVQNFALAVGLITTFLFIQPVGAQTPAPRAESSTNEPLPKVSPIPQGIRQYYHLAPIYKKYTHVRGFPIVATDKPSDYALLEAAYVIREVTRQRLDLLRTLGTNRARVIVMGVTEYPSDFPEYRKPTTKENEFLDKRSRIYGGKALTVGEENLLKLRGDIFPKGCMLLHEFAHNIHLVAMKAMDPGFDKRLQQLYETAKRETKWPAKDYKMLNQTEYWAVNVQDWFMSAQRRETVMSTDPELAALIAKTFGGCEWLYALPQQRKVTWHLEGFDREHAPNLDGKLLAKRYPNPKFEWQGGKLVALDKNPAATMPPKPNSNNRQNDATDAGSATAHPARE